MRLIAIGSAFLAIFAWGPALSQEIRLERDFMNVNSDDFAYELVQQVVQKLPHDERAIAQDVVIYVEDTGIDASPRAGEDAAGNPVVILPFGFLRVMQEMVVAQLLVYDGYQPRTYLEEWLTYWGLRSSPGNNYDGPLARMPLEYAWIKDHERERFLQEFNETIVLIYVSALVDVILHEIGHHVADARYDQDQVSSSEARRLEARADDWASYAFLNFAVQTPEAGWFDRSNLMGRMFALNFIRELEASGNFISLKSPRTHPETDARLRSALDLSSCENENVPENFQEICNSIRETTSHLLSERRTQEEYRNLSEAGDSFAAFKLAFMRGMAGDHAEACELFVIAAERGIDQRVHRHIGQCYAEGFLGISLSIADRNVEAVRHLCIASRDGWRDARTEMRDLIAREGLDNNCSR